MMTYLGSTPNLRALFVLPLFACAALACGSDSTSPGTGSTSTGGGATSSGTTSTSGTSGAGGATSGAGGATSGAGGGSTGSAGGGTTVAGSGGGGSGGASTGSGGSSSSGGAGGSAGGGNAGSSGSMPEGGAPTGGCPASAAFCSGFEEATLPSGASYRPSYQADMWSMFMGFDTGVKKFGTQSLKVKPGAAGYSWQMLSVPSGGADFWVRLYVRSDADLGQAEHNSYFQAMTGTGEPNVGDNVEVSEQYCQIVLNVHDAVTLSGGDTKCGSGGALLTKDTWHCMEAHFDGPGGAVQVYADKNATPIISKTGLAKYDYKSFSFGFLGFHGPARTMWYDDVAVAQGRIGCTD